ncbi:MAG: hypothetical protein IJZ79_01825 [Bacilli bacterium]|nr:hypothetical protein [Bacilli bacterium]
MEIKITLVIKSNKKFLIKKEKYDLVVNENDILYYFENVATPYDMKYTFSHLNDDELIKSWIQRIAKYNNSTNSTIRTGEILQCNVSDSDINNMRKIIDKIADKRELKFPNKR